MNDVQARATAETTGTEDLKRRGWIYAGYALLVLVAGFPAVASLVNIYDKDTSFNHGFLIPLISVWVAWGRKDLLKDLRPGTSLLGVLGIVGAAGLYFLGWLFSLQLFQHAAVIGALQAGILAIFGWQVFRAFLFPVAFLVFCVPFGTEAVPTLQSFTAWFSVRALQLFGIPVYSDGIMIEVPGGMFEVAEACAGLRFMISTLALGALFGMMAFRSWTRRIAVMALAIIVPVIANGIRALLMILIGYWSKMTLAVGFDHIVYGYVFLVIVMGLLILLGMAFSDRKMHDPDLTDADLVRIRAAAPGRGHGAIVGAAAAVFAATGAFAVMKEGAPLPTLDLEPTEIAGYAVDLPPTVWTPAFKGTQAETLEHLIGPGGDVDVFTSLYKVQKEGAELIAFANRLDPTDFSIVDRMTIVPKGDAPALKYQRLSGPEGTRHVFFSYWTRGGLTLSEREVKFAAARGKLGMDGAAAIVAASVVGGSREEALKAVLPVFDPVRLDARLARALKTQGAR